MATAFLKFFLPPPLRRPLQNLKLIPYQVPTFTPPPIHVPNQQLFLRPFTYLSHSLPRPRRPRMPTLKSVIYRRQRGTGGPKYCSCADCQGKRLLNRVPYLPSYFRRTRAPNPYFKNAGYGGQQQICKRKLHTDARGNADDVDKGGRFWTRLRRALRATKVQWYPYSDWTWDLHMLRSRIYGRWEGGVGHQLVIGMINDPQMSWVGMTLESMDLGNYMF